MIRAIRLTILVKDKKMTSMNKANANKANATQATQATEQSYFDALKDIKGFGQNISVVNAYKALKDAESSVKIRFIDFITLSMFYVKSKIAKCSTDKGRRGKIRDALRDECGVRVAKAQLQKYSLLIEYVGRRIGTADGVKDFLADANTTQAYKIARTDAPNPMDALKALKDADASKQADADANKTNASKQAGAGAGADADASKQADADADATTLTYKSYDTARTLLKDLDPKVLTDDELLDLYKFYVDLGQKFVNFARMRKIDADAA